MTVIELPDDYMAFVLVGHDGTTYRVVKTDDQGQLYALLRGNLESGGVGTVTLDDDGQMIVILKGASGTPVDVDADGLLGAVVRGQYTYTGQEKVQNPSFEIAGAGGADKFASWAEYASGSGSVNDETIDVYDGSHAVRFDGGTGYEVVYQDVAVVPGLQMTYSFYTHGDGTVDGMYRLYDLTNGAEIVPPTDTNITGITYERFSDTVTIPAGCVLVRVYLYSFQGAGTSVYFDLASFKVTQDPVSTILATDSDGQIVMVPRGVNGYYMDVDENGFLSVILKALYGDTPTGVACDAEGRLKFFLTDDVDQWGQYLEVGNAELAARISGPVHAFNRTGQVLYWTTFRDGLGPWQLQTAVGGAGALLTTDWLQDGQCYNLTTAGADADTASITLPIGAPVAGESLGFACWLRYAALFDYVRFRMRYFDGTTTHEGYIKLLNSNEKIYAYNDLGVDYEVGAWDNAASARAIWHYLKFTFDLGTGAYKKLIWDGEEIDISGVDYYQSATPYLFLQTDVYINGAAGTSGDLRVDCPVLTCRES